jgi:hypothetical protein
MIATMIYYKLYHNFVTRWSITVICVLDVNLIFFYLVISFLRAIRL